MTELSSVEDLGALSLPIVHPPSHVTSGHAAHVTESRPLEVMLKIECEVRSDHPSCNRWRKCMELIDLTEQQSRMPVLHSLGMGGL